MRTLSLIVIAGLLSGCGLAPNPTYAVRYAVEGDAKAATITMQNAQGGTEQTTVRLPWSRKMSVRAGAFLYLSAQNQGARGSIHCSIDINGAPFKYADSDGPYSIASCDGST